jgi:hypothetical protein
VFKKIHNLKQFVWIDAGEAKDRYFQQASIGVWKLINAIYTDFLNKLAICFCD